MSMSANTNFIKCRSLSTFSTEHVSYIMIYFGPLSKKNPGPALAMDPYPFCVVNDRMMSLTCIKFEDLKSFGQGKPARTTLGDIDQFFSQTHQAPFKQSTVHHDFA